MRYRRELDRRLSPDGLPPRAIGSRARLAVIVTAFAVLLPVGGVVAFLAIHDRRAADRATRAAQYRGPDACTVVDRAAMTALVLHAGGAHGELTSERLSRPITIHYTGLHPRDVASTVVFGSQCSTGEPVNGVGNDARVQVTLERSNLVDSASHFRAAWRLEHLGAVDSADGDLLEGEHSRSDGRPDDCFDVVLVQSQPDPLIETVTAEATGHCDTVTALLRHIEDATDVAPVAPTDLPPTTAPAPITAATAQPVQTTTTAIVDLDPNGTDPNPALSRPFPAWWTIDPSAVPTPESTSLHLLVTEQQCASGISPDGRISASVEYTAEAVTVSVIVASVGGFADCQGIPPTPFELQLTEPIGNRPVLGQDPPPF